MDYDTVTSYCFQTSWRDLRKQCWWPSSKGTLKQAFGLHPVEAVSGLTHQTQDELKRYVRSSTCVAVGEIGLDYTRVRSANGRVLQRKVFGRLCRFANEIGKPIVIHCRGMPASGVFSDCLTIMTQNPSRAHQVYWHRFSGNAAVAREIENAFPSVVFGVAPGVLKEQYDDVLEDFIRSKVHERLLVESNAPIVGERGTSNHPWAVSTILAGVASVKAIPTQIMAKLVRKKLVSSVWRRRVRVVLRRRGGV